MKMFAAALASLIIFPSIGLGTPASIMTQLRKTHGLPALGVTILDHGVTQQFISGVRKHHELKPVEVDDKFHLGSNTKAMTATVAAILIERGLFSWEQTLAHSFPKLEKKMHPAFKKVTVAMLTSHMSGLTGAVELFDKRVLWKTLWNPSLDPVEGRKIVASAMLLAAPASTPGSKFEYTNAGYIILGAIMESATGKSWETLMREELFTPLAMKSCGFGSPANAEVEPPDQPWPHVPAITGPAPVLPDLNSDNPRTVGPAGGVHCSMADWAKFAQLHIDAFNGQNQKAKSFAKLYETPPGEVYTYGGWIKVPEPWAGGVALTHAGSNGLNMSTIWIAPLKSRAYIVVTNIGGDQGAGTAMDETILRMIAGDFAPPK